MAELISNRYEIIKSIGKGGMADVFLAYDNVLRREVAIKVLKDDMSSDPSSLERFRREAHASVKISHPNIVDIYDVGDDGDKHYIVMEYVNGCTLKQLIKKRGAIPPREAIWMIKQLASALFEAHKNGLIHRDVKSQNVLIKADGTIKLTDFGIAILNNSVQLTSTNSILGSVHYLAPEISRGDNATMQSDIYSLGIVLFELLTGDVPYKADTPVQVALKHIKESIPDVKKFNPQIPQSVKNILTKATAKNLKNRYPNIAYMMNDLNTCMNKDRINEPPIVFESNKNVAKIKKKKQKEKTENNISAILIISISLFSILALILILFISGSFSFNSRFVKIPEVVGLNLASATDAISEAGLDIVKPIERITTDDVESGIVISITPNENKEVERGSKVSLVVSAGTHVLMEDFVNKNIDYARTKLLNTALKIKINNVVNDEVEEGTILSQDGIKPNEKYNPSKNDTIYFDVAGPETIRIPSNIIGANIDEISSELINQGFNVVKKQVSIDEVNDEILEKYDKDIVYKVEPAQGEMYYKKEDSVILLYYY